MSVEIIISKEEVGKYLQEARDVLYQIGFFVNTKKYGYSDFSEKIKSETGNNNYKIIEEFVAGYLCVKDSLKKNKVLNGNLGNMVKEAIYDSISLLLADECVLSNGLKNVATLGFSGKMYNNSFNFELTEFEPHNRAKLIFNNIFGSIYKKSFDELTDKNDWIMLNKDILTNLKQYAYSYLRGKNFDAIKNDLSELYITLDNVMFHNLSLSQPHIIKSDKDKRYPIFDDIGGYEEEKKTIRNIIDIFEYKRLAKIYNAELPKAIIVYGPPGTGKSFLMNAVANEVEIPFYIIRYADLASDFQNRTLMRMKDELESKENSLILIEEGETLMSKRNEKDDKETLDQRNFFLTYLDNTNNIVAITTNRPNVIDRGFWRRCFKIYMRPPNKMEILDIFKKQVAHIHKKSGFDMFSEISLEQIVEKVTDFTGADVNKFLIYSCNYMFGKLSSEEKKKYNKLNHDELVKLLPKITQNELESLLEPFRVMQKQISEETFT